MIEAMACGTPVIAYNRGSVPEVVDEGITGFVVEDENGASDFSLLQIDLKESRDRFIYYAFDLLHLDGRDLTHEPLAARKAELAKLLQAAGYQTGERRLG